MSKSRDRTPSKASVLRKRKSRPTLSQSSREDPLGENISDRTFVTERSPYQNAGSSNLSLTPAVSPRYNLSTENDTFHSPQAQLPPVFSSPVLPPHNQTPFIPGNTVFPLNASSYVDKNGIQVSVVIPLQTVPASALSPTYKYDNATSFNERLVSEGVQTVGGGRRRSSPGWGSRLTTPRARHTPRSEAVQSPPVQWQGTPTVPTSSSVRETPKRNSRNRRDSQTSSGVPKETTGGSTRRRARRSSVTFSTVEGVSPFSAEEAGGSPMPPPISQSKSRRNSSSGRTPSKNSRRQRRSVNGEDASPDKAGTTFSRTTDHSLTGKRHARGSKRLSLRSVASDFGTSVPASTSPAEIVGTSRNSLADISNSHQAFHPSLTSDPQSPQDGILLSPQQRSPSDSHYSYPANRLPEASSVEDLTDKHGGVARFNNLLSSLWPGRSHSNEENKNLHELTNGEMHDGYFHGVSSPSGDHKVFHRDNSLNRAIENRKSGGGGMAIITHHEDPNLNRHETDSSHTESDFMQREIRRAQFSASEEINRERRIFPSPRRRKIDHRQNPWWEIIFQTGWEAICCWKVNPNRTLRTSGDRRNIRAIRGLFLLLLILGHMTADQSLTDSESASSPASSSRLQSPISFAISAVWFVVSFPSKVFSYVSSYHPQQAPSTPSRVYTDPGPAVDWASYSRGGRIVREETTGVPPWWKAWLSLQLDHIASALMPTYVVHQWLQKHEEEEGKEETEEGGGLRRHYQDSKALTTSTTEGHGSRFFNFRFLTASSTPSNHQHRKGNKNSWLNYFPFYDYEKDPTVLLLDAGSMSDTRYFYYEGETGQVTIKLGKAVALSGIGIERRPPGDPPWKKSMSSCDAADPRSVTVLIWRDMKRLEPKHHQHRHSHIRQSSSTKKKNEERRKMRSSSFFSLNKERVPPQKNTSQQERDSSYHGETSGKETVEAIRPSNSQMKREENLCDSFDLHSSTFEEDSSSPPGCWLTVQTFEIPCVTRKRIHFFPLLHPLSTASQNVYHRTQEFSRDSPSYLGALQKNIVNFFSSATDQSSFSMEEKSHPFSPAITETTDTHEDSSSLKEEEEDEDEVSQDQKAKPNGRSSTSSSTTARGRREQDEEDEQKIHKEECVACHIPMEECIITDKVKLLFKSRSDAPTAYTRLYRLRVFGCEAALPT